jgi:hypothetical protein
VPAAVRGTNNTVNMHVSDWYATFATIANVDPTDDPPVLPLPGNPHRPFDNIYGNRSFPPADGRSLWSAITEPAALGNSAPDAVHPQLVLSKEVLLAGRWKLLVSQPHFKTQNNGWHGKDGTWVPPTAAESFDCLHQDLGPAVSFFPTTASPSQVRRGTGIASR